MQAVRMAILLALLAGASACADGVLGGDPASGDDDVTAVDDDDTAPDDDDTAPDDDDTAPGDDDTAPGDDDTAPDDDDATPGDDDDDDDDTSIGDDDDTTQLGDVTAALSPCPAPIESLMADAVAIAPGPDSEGWVPPSAAARTALQASIQALVADDAAGAEAEAQLAGYLVCRGEGPELGTALWRPVSPGRAQAVIAFRAVNSVPLIAEVPHPNYESNVFAQGLSLFNDHNARALIVSGTQVCSNTAESGCTGTTTVCGGSGNYRVSDMAHSVETMYQSAHVALADLFDQTWAVTLRGMSLEGATLSDGTTGTVGSGTGLALFATALAAALPSENITTCSTWAGSTVPQDQRFCATTTVQGRHLNGSPLPCSLSVSSSLGRFINLQQSSAVRAQSALVLSTLVNSIPSN